MVRDAFRLRSELPITWDMHASRRPVVVRGHLRVGGPTAVAVLVLVVAGALLFAANKDSPRDFTGYPYALVPFIGTALLTRGNAGAGFAAAVLSIALGYVVAMVAAVIAAVAALS